MSKKITFIVLSTLFLFSFENQNSMTQTWQKIESWINKANPLMNQSFNVGASDAQIQDVERELKISLPTSYKDFIKIHNGQKFGSDALIDLETLNSSTEIVSQWKIWKELLDAGEFATYKSNPEHGIKDDWFNPKWVPITNNGYGDHICIDLDPAAGGTKGQIITLVHDDARRELLAPSFEVWINKYVTDLENDIYIYSEDYGGIIKASELEE